MVLPNFKTTTTTTIVVIKINLITIPAIYFIIATFLAFDFLNFSYHYFCKVVHIENVSN